MHALAIFLQRKRLSDYRAKCQPDASGDALAHDLQQAGETLRENFAAAGFDARSL